MNKKHEKKKSFVKILTTFSLACARQTRHISQQKFYLLQ